MSWIPGALGYLLGRRAGKSARNERVEPEPPSVLASRIVGLALLAGLLFDRCR